MKIEYIIFGIVVMIIVVVLGLSISKELFVGPVFWSRYPQMNTKPNCNLAPYYSQLYGSGLGVSCC